MRTGFASLAIVGVAACVAVYAINSQPKNTSLYTELTTEDMQFLQWISKFGKSYGTKEEFQFRANLFKEALVKIAAENSRNENTFTLGLNKFADWTPAEFKRILGTKARRTAPTEFHESSLDSIPDSIDWRTLGAVNPVQDQQQCGSCWAFSAIGAIEGRYEIKNKVLKKFSEQQLVDCMGPPTYESEGCNGGWMWEGIDYSYAQGNMLESDYPYTAMDGNCQYNKAKVAGQPTAKHIAVKPNSGDALINAIAEGPVSVGIEADTFVFQMYSGGVLNSKQCGTDIDHGVVAVGYGVSGSTKYYIVRNSWGKGWGMSGYVNIAYQAQGKGICGIQQDNVVAQF